MNSSSSSVRGPRSLAALAIALQLAGCAHGIVVHAHKAELGSSKLRPRLALVSPVELRWDEPSALLSYLRALDVEAALCTGGTLATLGPGELAPVSPSVESPGADDVSRVSLRTGVPVGEILLVRSSAERREQRSSVHLNDAAGKSAGSARDALVTLVARVEVSLPAAHLLVAEASVEEELDPSGEQPLFDAQPELSTLLRRAVLAAMAEAASALDLPVPIDFGLATLPAPAPALGYSMPKRRSFAESIGSQDALEQEVSRNGALDLVAAIPTGPESLATAPDAALRRSLRLDRPGLLVVDSQGRARAAGILPGDHIVSIDGAPANHPCAPMRAVLLTHKNSHLQLEREGELKAVSF